MTESDSYATRLYDGFRRNREHESRRAALLRDAEELQDKAALIPEYVTEMSPWQITTALLDLDERLRKLETPNA